MSRGSVPLLMRVRPGMLVPSAPVDAEELDRYAFGADEALEEAASVVETEASVAGSYFHQIATAIRALKATPAAPSFDEGE